MSFSLESIGMEPGARYESIYTTMNSEGEINAAPMGVKCINDYDVADAYLTEAKHWKI